MAQSRLPSASSKPATAAASLVHMQRRYESLLNGLRTNDSAESQRSPILPGKEAVVVGKKADRTAWRKIAPLSIVSVSVCSGSVSVYHRFSNLHCNGTEEVKECDKNLRTS